MHPGSLYRMQRREPECTTATISQSRLRRRPDKVLKLGEFPPDVLVLARGVVDFEESISLASHGAVAKHRPDDDRVLPIAEHLPLRYCRTVPDLGTLAATRNEKSPVHCWPGLVVYLALSYSRGTLRSDYHRRWRA